MSTKQLGFMEMFKQSYNNKANPSVSFLLVNQ